MSSAYETRIPLSKDTRRTISEFKRSPDNWDTTLRKMYALAREAEKRGIEPSDAGDVKI